jgi:hypothetical protein
MSFSQFNKPGCVDVWRFVCGELWFLDPQLVHRVGHNARDIFASCTTGAEHCSDGFRRLTGFKQFSGSAA